MISTQRPQHTVKCSHSHRQTNTGPSSSNVSPGPQRPAQRDSVLWLGEGRQAESTVGLTATLPSSLSSAKVAISLRLVSLPLVKCRLQHLLSDIGYYQQEYQAQNVHLKQSSEELLK